LLLSVVCVNTFTAFRSLLLILSLHSSAKDREVKLHLTRGSVASAVPTLRDRV
jgi:hypothetical protein